MRKVGLAVGLVLGLAAGVLQAQAGWTVKPEWVRAHEEFLASDVMAGRGSATRDEEITATYVASEFMGYGLKPAPGMQGYLQSAGVVFPVLDGHATLKLGDVALQEGADFTMLTATGVTMRGQVMELGGAALRSPVHAPGAAVLISSLPEGMSSIQAVRALRGSGVALVVLVEDESTRKTAQALGGKPRTSPYLQGELPANGGNVVTVSKATMDKLLAHTGAGAELDVKAVAPAVPRKTFNAIGYLEGTDPTSGTILLTAHLDHLGIGHAIYSDGIYNGANDDASGTTAVLELAHALAAGPRLKRNVLFVCYGSEEVGELGSTYFGQHPPVPLKSLVTNLEFEMIGTQDPKMPNGILLLTGWERSNLGPTLKEHGALIGPDPYPEQHFFERSDNYALALQGVVAHTAAGWGTPPTYHQPSDDLQHLNVPFMVSVIQSLVEPVRWLANNNFKPVWNPGGQPVKQ